MNADRLYLAFNLALHISGVCCIARAFTPGSPSWMAGLGGGLLSMAYITLWNRSKK